MYKIILETKDKKIELENVIYHYISIKENDIMAILLSENKIMYIPINIIKQFNIITNYENTLLRK